MPEVTDAQIAAYEPLCEALARRFVGRNGVEADDLVQEGRIFVWQSLKRGIHPSAEMIENRMRDLVRLEGRQRQGEGVPYEAMLPLDDYTEAAALDVAPSLG